MTSAGYHFIDFWRGKLSKEKRGVQKERNIWEGGEIDMKVRIE